MRQIDKKPTIFNPRKIFASLALLILTVSIFQVLGVNKTHAIQTNVGWVPQDILNQIATFDASNNRDNKNNGQCYYPFPTLYAQSEWPWIYSGAINNDMSTPGTAITLSQNQTTQLNIYILTFLCHWAVNGNPIFGSNSNSPTGGESSGNPFFPADNTVGTAFGAPNGCILDWPGTTCASGGGPGSQWLSTTTKYGFPPPQVVGCTNNGGSCGGNTGSVVGGISGANPQITNFTNQSRWWQPNGSTQFNFKAPSAPGRYAITLRVFFNGASYFDRGSFGSTYDCIGSGSIDANLFNNNVLGNCQNFIDLTINVNVPNPPPPPVLQCTSINLLPTNQPGEGDNFSAQVNYSISPNNASNFNGSGRLSGAGVNGLPSTQPINGVNGTPGLHSLIFNGLSVNTGGSHSLSFSATANSPGSVGASCPMSFNFISSFEPIFKATGGDIVSGSLFDIGTGSCFSNNAAIVGWNKNASPFAGSGTAFGGFATGVINGFATGQNTATNSGSGLSFSNNNYNAPPFGEFGGKFRAAPCATDYRAQLTGTPGPISGNISAAGSQSYLDTSNTTITASTIGINNHPTIYVDGNLTINGDIKYAPFTSATNIPKLKVVVCGNIYIDSNVDRIDGTYIAEPSSSGGNNTKCNAAVGNFDKGVIYTCTNGPNDSYRRAPNWYAKCSLNRLTVNGGLVANAIQFERAQGSLSSNNPAELFNYSPEEWLAGVGNGGISSSNCSGGGSTCYDSITSLPPIL